MHNEEYRVVIEYFFKWKRGLYQLPPYKQASALSTEWFNMMEAFYPHG